MKFSKCGFAEQTVLLAPAGAAIPGGFRRLEENEQRHSALLTEVQRLRGRIMVEEGALEKDRLDAQGRHRTRVDDEAWHMASLDNAGRVNGCFRFLVHPPTVSLLRLTTRRAARAGDGAWRQKVCRALEKELAATRKHAFSLVEFGGWVLSAELRGTPEAFKMALIAFAWSQMAGGCFGLTTATVQHGSSSILRRLGGTPLRADNEAIEQYYDVDYNCRMELLKFDSRSPNPRYQGMIRDVRTELANAVIVRRPMVEAYALAS